MTTPEPIEVGGGFPPDHCAPEPTTPTALPPAEPSEPATPAEPAS